MGNYSVSVKRYFNSVDGFRYNVSVNYPRYVKEPMAVDVLIPTYGGESVGRRVHPREERDKSSILRAIREIRNIGLSNDWDYFVTFTLDPKKCDRSDYPTAVKRMVRFFRYLRSRMSVDIQYLLIPELHADGLNWHFHGLMKGIPESLLTPHPLNWQREKGYKDFPVFASRFGFVSLSPVKSTSAVVYYCLKYINKDIFSMRYNDGMRLYYVSKGIQRPQEVFKHNIKISPAYLSSNFFTTDFNTGYVRSLDSDSLHSILSDILFDDSYYKEDFDNDFAF